MPAPTWNPGEFVYDQSTGEPYIDENGDTHEVETGSKLVTSDGRVIDADDVAAVAFYVANKHEGETLRAADVGVPYIRLALGTGDVGQAIAVVVAEIRERTPGVAGVISVRDVVLNATTRTLGFAATIVRQGGQEQTFSTLVG